MKRNSGKSTFGRLGLARDGRSTRLFLEPLEERRMLAAVAYVTTDDPWGTQENDNSLNAAFGAGNWDKLSFAQADTNQIFTNNTYDFVFLEGSDDNGDDFENFLTAQRTAMQAWVQQGGHLFENAARNVVLTASLNVGFGITLENGAFSQTVKAANPGWAIFHGPATPVVTDYTGTSFGHDAASGSGLVPLIVNADDGKIVLGYKSFGAGSVVVGGMTTMNFHHPLDEARNLRTNILEFAASLTPITGTPNKDRLEITFSSATEFDLDLNGTVTHHTVGTNSGQVSNLVFDGDGGSDTVIIHDLFNTRSATIGHGLVSFQGSDFTFEGVNSEIVYLYGTGDDTAEISDNGAGGIGAVRPGYAFLTDAAVSFFYEADGYGKIDIDVAPGFSSQATLYSAAGVAITAFPDEVTFEQGTATRSLGGFAQTTSYASDLPGESFALFGTRDPDKLVATPLATSLAGVFGVPFVHQGVGYNRVDAFGNGGIDTAAFTGSRGNDILAATPTYAYLQGGAGLTAFYIKANGFLKVNAAGGGGSDKAYLYDSTGDDKYVGTATYAYLTNGTFFNQVTGFAYVQGIARSGNDKGYLFDTPGQNILTASGNGANLLYALTANRRIATGFDFVKATASLGNVDLAHVIDHVYELQLAGPWR